MRIEKVFIKDFEPEKLDAIFGRTMTDIEHLMKVERQEDVYDTPHLAYSQYTELLTNLKQILVNDTHIEKDEGLTFDHFEDFKEVIVPRMKVFVQFLNEQFEAGNLCLVGRYEIEFFEMLAEM